MEIIKDLEKHLKEISLTAATATKTTMTTTTTKTLTKTDFSAFIKDLGKQLKVITDEEIAFCNIEVELKGAVLKERLEDFGVWMKI